MNGADVLSDFEARGLIHDSTDRAALGARLDDGPIGVYYGCDPTADSLHVGNLIGLVALRRFQDAGHRAIALAGGATGMVGDPGGRSEERNLLDADTLAHNVAAIKEQISRIVDLDGDRGELVDNRDWTAEVSLLDFLRDVGKHVTVNQMIARESVKNRLASEHGISYTEFSYMLLQANDYLWLHDHRNCHLQVGGADQWGNLLSGVDLIRRARGAQVHALSWPLLLAADGSKLGKTTGARTWLDADKTTPFQFQQHFVNLSDAEVAQQLPMLSLRPSDEIDGLLAAHDAEPHRRLAQSALADELTALVHGPAAAATAAAAAAVLFGGDPTAADEATIAAVGREVPTTTVSAAALDDPAALFADAGVTASRGEARRLIDQRGIRVNGVQLGADVTLATITPLHGRWMLVRRGKTAYSLLEISPA